MDQERHITLTPSARAAAHAYAAENSSFSGKCLRVYLAGKGCDGFEYGVTFDDQVEGDVLFPVDESLTIVVDTPGLEILAGAQIDFVDDERGRGFLVENPLHKAFRGKFFKRNDWRERTLRLRTGAGPSSPISSADSTAEAAPSDS